MGRKEWSTVREGEEGREYAGGVSEEGRRDEGGSGKAGQGKIGSRVREGRDGGEGGGVEEATVTGRRDVEERLACDKRKMDNVVGERGNLFTKIEEPREEPGEELGEGDGLEEGLAEKEKEKEVMGD